jgi:hypothetical protein
VTNENIYAQRFCLTCLASCYSHLKVKKEKSVTKKTAVVLVLLFVAALCVAGCTSTQNAVTNTTTAEPTAHNATLDKFVTAYRQYVADVRGPGNGTVTAWQVTWPNATTVNVQAAGRYTQPIVNVTYNRTVIIFPTTDAATAFLNAYNKTGYFPSNVTTERGNVSQTALGHPLTVLKAYGAISGDARAPHNLELEQADNLIIITDSTVTPT